MDFETFAGNELSELALRLVQAAARDAEVATARAVATLQPTIDQLAADRDRLLAEEQRLNAEHAALRAAQNASAESSAQQLESASARLTEAAQRNDQLRADTERLAAEIAALRSSQNASAESSAHQLESTSARLAEAGRQNEQLRAETERLAAEIAVLQAEKTASAGLSAKKVDEAAARVAQAAQHNERLSVENDRLAAEHAALSFEKAALVESARGLQDTVERLTQAADRGALLERLLGTFERIDRSTTPEDVLAAAAGGFLDDCSRTVAFLVRDDRLEAVHWHGLDLSKKPNGAVVPLTSDSLIALAARAHHPRVFDAESRATDETPFGAAPSIVVTAPIAVRGELTALLYADDAGVAGGSSLGHDNSVRLAALLQRHAALRLERLTIELKAMAELRAYAQMLIDEVEYVHVADVSSKKSETEQIDRLAENLRCARQIFQQRVTVEGPAAAALLDEILARAIESRAGTPFGRHLGVAAARIGSVSSLAHAS